MASSPWVHTVVLDVGPMLRNDPSISSLLAKSKRIVTVPAVISEVKDPDARSRIETSWLPFLEIRQPNATSIELVTNFARRTGDLVVLSKVDIQVLALIYQIQYDKNGDSSIRTMPGQKLENPSSREGTGKKPVIGDLLDGERLDSSLPRENPTISTAQAESEGTIQSEISLSNELPPIFDLTLQNEHESKRSDQDNQPKPQSSPTDSITENSDSDGWITPSNIQKHRAKDSVTTKTLSERTPVDVACITSDFAMQNVLLQMNLPLLSTSLQRVRNIKTYALRCYACFMVTKQTTIQFCPRCGKPCLTRVSCSTDFKGRFKIHLKKNIEWNHRGDRYSIPKPVSGNASGKAAKAKGGGKNGWGQSLILTEDQKEYQRAIKPQGRKKESDLMDEDYLPSILTSDRGRIGGRPKIGAGRNVNSMKRR
ncbi:MAG: hypothetical protein LQ342_002652 [Letrouitia transgressa]|nr:MAG: hypothetical protein LQ342_002652 [Letrouitia transgressa]